MNAYEHRRLYLLFLLGASTFTSSTAPLLAQANSKTSEASLKTPGEVTKAAPLTDKDTVVLGDFDNKTSETVFDDVLKQALALALEQSPFLNVLSDRKVSEAFRTMGRPLSEHITPGLGRALCLHTGSKAVIRGKILNLRGRYLIELTAITCSSGDAPG